MVGEAEGATAVRIARGAIAARLGPDAPRDAAQPYRSADLPPVFDERRGVFVTLTEGRSDALRGCIGFPLPVLALRVAIPRAAVAAAVDDPRFPPLEPRELGRTRIEVSLLTPPEVVGNAPEERPAAVRVGQDGLIIDRDDASGLLLPQVAVEWGWDARQFLDETCRKAGLAPSAWRSPATRLRRFQAEIFREREPGGPVEPRGPEP